MQFTNSEPDRARRASEERVPVRSNTLRMKEELIWAKIERLTVTMLFREEANIELLLRGFQQIAAIVSGDAKIGFKLTLGRNLSLPRYAMPFTNEVGELVEG